MAYIGNEPTSVAFVTDLFSGNGSTVAFTMSVAPANTASVLIAVSGVVQSPDTYSINATTLTFSAAPPAGTGNISVRYLGIPATNVTTTAYRTVTEFTATAGQTVFPVPSYTVGYIDVYRNGARLGTADYTATNGISVTLSNAAAVGDLVVTESFYVSSVLNAIPAQAGQVGSAYLASGGASQAFLDVGTGTGTGALLTPLGTTAQRPASPAVGMQRWNTTIGGMEVYVGNNWQTIASTAYTVDYLVVAGGGGGGGRYYSGGGGAGGYLTGAGISISPGVTYTVTVGAGGAGGSGDNVRGVNGSNSSISGLGINTAIGGGGGGSYNSTSTGLSGGSGGGGSGYGGSPGAGTAGQGFAGGSGGTYGAGAGGGAGAVGQNGGASNGGIGGVGVSNSYSGLATFYAGGGGGGGYTGTGGAGGAGGGGAGETSTNTPTSGTANTGGGGGGPSQTNPGGSGGSGVVIIRYLGTVQRATGGTVTITGGYVIHTFISSGTYTA